MMLTLISLLSFLHITHDIDQMRRERKWTWVNAPLRDEKIFEPLNKPAVYLRLRNEAREVKPDAVRQAVRRTN